MLTDNNALGAISSNRSKKIHINVRPKINAVIDLLINPLTSTLLVDMLLWKKWKRCLLNCSSGGVCSYECTVLSTQCSSQNNPVCRRHTIIQFSVRNSHLLAGTWFKPRLISSTDYLNMYFNALLQLNIYNILHLNLLPWKNFCLPCQDTSYRTFDEDYEEKATSILLTWCKSHWSQYRNSSLVLVSLGLDHLK